MRHQLLLVALTALFFAFGGARAQQVATNSTDENVDDNYTQFAALNISVRAERFMAYLVDLSLPPACYAAVTGEAGQRMLRSCQWMYGSRWPDYVAPNGSVTPVPDVNGQISTLCSSNCSTDSAVWERAATAACGDRPIFSWHNVSGALSWIARNVTIGQPFPYTLAVADYQAVPLSASDFRQTTQLMLDIACAPSGSRVSRNDTPWCSVENSIKIRQYNTKNIISRLLSNPFQNCGACMFQLMEQLSAARSLKILTNYRNVIDAGNRTVTLTCRSTGTSTGTTSSPSATSPTASASASASPARSAANRSVVVMNGATAVLYGAMVVMGALMAL